MNPHIMRVISSPSNSTKGVLTSIFAIISSRLEYRLDRSSDPRKGSDHRIAHVPGQAVTGTSLAAPLPDPVARSERRHSVTGWTAGRPGPFRPAGRAQP